MCHPVDEHIEAAGWQRPRIVWALQHARGGRRPPRRANERQTGLLDAPETQRSNVEVSDARTFAGRRRMATMNQHAFLTDEWFAAVKELVTAAGNLEVPPALAALSVNV